MRPETIRFLYVMTTLFVGWALMAEVVVITHTDNPETALFEIFLPFMIALTGAQAGLRSHFPVPLFQLVTPLLALAPIPLGKTAGVVALYSLVALLAVVGFRNYRLHRDSIGNRDS